MESYRFPARFHWVIKYFPEISPTFINNDPSFLAKLDVKTIIRINEM